jgi:hypothetical protein
MLLGLKSSETWDPIACFSDVPSLTAIIARVATPLKEGYSDDGNVSEGEESDVAQTARREAYGARFLAEIYT